MAWRQAMQKNMQRKASQVEYTTEAVQLRIVASKNSPFGMGVVGPVNAELNNKLKTIRSPSDNFTHVLNWFKAGGMWAHLLPAEHAGFCTLGDLLEDDQQQDDAGSACVASRHGGWRSSCRAPCAKHRQLVD